ncbi:isoprenoid biosynthesis glyoxalase ElbB [Thalassotalea profundi]|uniref:Glyoxalase n=1 Tax=Thalassotalea profundi TaxID=2036687 RepID=A0ABQ3J6H3_9GAMM|nr:isoprenoid biosynthesis glyoxalase ElbB [Thalassotalea profundi]GHF00830.1 glyoxalase [Thalassotalea profundi]
MKNVAVILSGCGVYDGSEIHEAVLTLLALDQQGAKYRCFAPNINQYHVINHLTGEVSENETRNVLVESARISRGDVENIEELCVDEFDAIIFPGGFGAAKNLCDFAINGENCTVNPLVLNAAKTFANANKPAGYMCIAPAMLPFVYGEHIVGTIGNDAGVAQALTQLGLKHKNCAVDDIVVDEKSKLVTTPAYMLATSISEAAQGINKLVTKVLELS